MSGSDGARFRTATVSLPKMGCSPARSPGRSTPSTCAPLAAWSTAASFGIAATRAGLVAAVFMRLTEADTLVRLAALTGVFWTAILFTLSRADVLGRLNRSGEPKIDAAGRTGPWHAAGGPA